MKENLVTETWRASLAIEAIDSVAIAAIHATDSMANKASRERLSFCGMAILDNQAISEVDVNIDTLLCNRNGKQLKDLALRFFAGILQKQKWGMARAIYISAIRVYNWLQCSLKKQGEAWCQCNLHCKSENKGRSSTWSLCDAAC